jgi:hypothetical protein
MDWTSYLIVALVGVAVGSVLTHLFSAWRDRKAAKRKASENFRAAVSEVLKDVYPFPVRWPDDIDRFLRGAFPALQAAVAQFEPFVPRRRREAFKKAWYNYRSGSGQEKEMQAYHHYMAFEDNPNYKEKFRQNVEVLLSFAK